MAAVGGRGEMGAAPAQEEEAREKEVPPEQEEEAPARRGSFDRASRMHGWERRRPDTAIVPGAHAAEWTYVRRWRGLGDGGGSLRGGGGGR